MLATLLLSIFALLQTAQDDVSPPATAAKAPSESRGEVDPEAPLQDHEIARIDGVSVPVDTFYHYLSLVYARLPEGNLALEQLLLEAILEQRAEAFGLEVSESEVAAVFAELDARARAATDGEKGLLDTVGPERTEALQHSVGLAALHRKLVAHELGLASSDGVDDAMLQAWLDEAMATAAVEEAPMSESVAARWTGGSFSRAVVGARISKILSPADLRGLLTELLGIHAIRHRATVMSIEFTPEAAADELLERERQVASNPSAEGVTYANIVEKVFQRTISELVASPKFSAEVLLRLIVDGAWDDESLASLFEAERPLFEEQLGGPVTFVEARFAVIKQVRQRTYQELLAGSRILRRL